MAPYLDLASYLSKLSLKEREAITHPDDSVMPVIKRSVDVSSFEALPKHILVARDALLPTGTPDYSGAVDPNELNMKGLQALFAIIGAAFVLGAIWFFFWAKNGGFQFRKGDWDDYKSTVLRRKGPNGTTLSNATKSTRLGGGSVVGSGFSDQDNATYADETSTVYTGTMTELSSSTAPIIKEKQSSRGGRSKNKRKETAKDKKQREMHGADWEGGHDDDVRAYRYEKPARVGGINRDSDAMHFGTDYTDTEGSAVASQTQSQRGGAGGARSPRKPSSRSHSPEKRSTYNIGGNNNHNSNSRREFSYTLGGDNAFSTTSASERAPSPAAPPLHVPGGFESPDHHQQHQHRHSSPSRGVGVNVNTNPPPPPQHNNRAPRYHSSSPTKPPAAARYAPSAYTASSYTASSYGGHSAREVQDQNTISYHHPIPALSQAAAQARGRGAGGPGGAGGGYRRDRRDSLDD